MSPAGLASCVTCSRAGDSVGWALLPPLLSPFGPQTGCLHGGRSRAPGCDSAGDTSGLWSHRTAHLCFSEAVACGPGFQSACILVLMVTLPWGHRPAWNTANKNTDSRGVCNPSSLKHSLFTTARHGDNPVSSFTKENEILPLVTMHIDLEGIMAE